MLMIRDQLADQGCHDLLWVSGSALSSQKPLL